MLEKKELNFEELENVSGGKFDDECRDWYNRNAEIIANRAKQSGNKYGHKKAMSDIFYSSIEHTVADFKQKLKEKGVDCDDLM